MGFIKAAATSTPRGDRGQFIQGRVTPAVVAAIKVATQVVFDESQILVPVKTGFLKSTGHTEISQTEKSVTGSVIYDAEYASHVEFGTSRMGSRSYLRAALDTTRDTVKEVFKSQIALSMK